MDTSQIVFAKPIWYKNINATHTKVFESKRERCGVTCNSKVCFCG